jgi:hypothetical protein
VTTDERRLLVLFLAIKAGLFAVALLAYALLPFNWQGYQVNLVLDLQRLPDAWRVFNTWDTQHYRLLVERGYGVNPMSNAFFPLYPWLTRALTPLFFGHTLLAALFVANAASLAVPVFLYRITARFFTPAQAFRAVLILLAFPTAFFLTVAYSEALFLALTLMAFYYLLANQRLAATICCFLLPLARAQALLFIVPIAVLALQDARANAAGWRAGVRPALSRFGLPAAATVLGLVAYLVFCRWQLGGFMAGLNAHGLYVNHSSLGNLLHPVDWFTRNFVAPTFTLHGYTTSIMDRVGFVLALAILAGVFRQQPKAFFVYAAITLLVPALAGSFMSYLRMLVVVFPLFIYLGVRWERSTLVLAPPLFVLQVLLFLMHTRSYWVA